MHVLTALDHLRFAKILSPTPQIDAILQELHVKLQLVNHDLQSRLLTDQYP